MALFGFAVYSVLGTLKSNRHSSQKPTQTEALLDLPGAVDVVQGGSIYRLTISSSPSWQAPNYDWVQVEPGPDGDILGWRTSACSATSTCSTPKAASCGNCSRSTRRSTSNNHWAYYPRVSPNGTTLFYVTDFGCQYASCGGPYNVDFEIQAVPLADPTATPVVWSESGLYFQGGDVEPIPLANGGIIYAKYDIDTDSGPGDGDTYAQLVYASSPYATLDYLTTPAQDCAEPALSPNGTEIAMVCTNNTLQTTTLQVASWNGTTLGTPVTISTGPEPASPTWSPNGTSVLYLNTLLTDKSSPFQLWWVPKANTLKPSAPQQVTENLNFTATSPPVWTE